MEGSCAIGRIRRGGAWLGFRPEPDGYRLVAGTDAEVRRGPADADVLLALAIAYFEEAFDDPPPELETSHADVSALVRDVARRERDATRRQLLSEAIDAIDDGLAGDAVANRLAAVRGSETSEQADPVDLLVALTEELLRD